MPDFIFSFYLQIHEIKLKSLNRRGEVGSCKSLLSLNLTHLNYKHCAWDYNLKQKQRNKVRQNYFRILTKPQYN